MEKTILIEEDLHQLIRIAAAKKGLKIKEVTEAALKEWIRNHVPELVAKVDELEKKIAVELTV